MGMFERVKGAVRSASSRVALVAGGLVAAGSASALDMDVTAVTTTITAVGASVAIIGAAVLSVKIGAKAWKWLSAAA